MSPLSLRSPQQHLFSRFRSRWSAPATLALVVALAILPACAAGGNTTTNTSNNSTPSATSTTAPTATPAKSSSLPPVTMAFCQQIMSLTDVNQIMQPGRPATLIKVAPLQGGGLCIYSADVTLTGLVVEIPLANYTGTKPIPEQQIEAYFKQGLGQPGVTVLNVKPVSGVGDQAGIVGGSYTYQGTTVYGAAFYVLFGNVVFDCSDVYLSSPTAAQQSLLQQCAQHVLGRL
jgi:hypothetical protein